MTNELAVNEAENTLPMEILSQMEEKAVTAVKEGGSGGASWLPYLQVMQGNSKKRRELNKDKGMDIKEGDVILNGREVIVLPATFDFLMISCETVARDFSDRDNIVSTTDTAGPVFQGIKERADENSMDSGCSYGPEYLIYIPDIGFAVWHASNATLKNAFSDLNRSWGQKFSLSTYLIDNGKHQWYGPKLGKCANVFDSPSMDDIKAIWELWKKGLNKSNEQEVDTGAREV